MSYCDVCCEGRVDLWSKQLGSHWEKTPWICLLIIFSLVSVSVWCSWMASCLPPDVPVLGRTQPVLKFLDRRQGAEMLREKGECLAGYHGTWAQQCCISINYHSGSRCFWSNSSRRVLLPLLVLADQHLVGITHQPPEKRDASVRSNTFKLIRHSVYDSMMKRRFSLSECTDLWNDRFRF